VDVGQLPVDGGASGERANRAVSNCSRSCGGAHVRQAHRSSLKCPTDDNCHFSGCYLPTWSSAKESAGQRLSPDGFRELIVRSFERDCGFFRPWGAVYDFSVVVAWAGYQDGRG